MELGAVFPTCEIGDDPVQIRDWAQAAEGLGYSYIVIYDHVVGAEHADREPALTGPYTQDDAFHEPFVLFGYLAAVTTSIEFETAVIIMPQRQTVLAAKQAAEVDVLSGGRLRLGVGTGWNYVEYESLAVDWAQRGRMLDEQIEVMRELWSNDLVDIDADFHRIDRAGIAPRPKQSIPIWLGGSSEVAMRRAARLGDGFTFASAGSRTVEMAEQLREIVAAANRDAGSYPIEFNMPYGLGPEKWGTLTQQAQDASISHLCINTMSVTSEWAGTPPSGLETPGDHIAGLERFIGLVR
ncbi:MAG TPA: LLM class F420-dependent oxidoreductase [Acidimicrobiales bacterium]|jgi:probable F420-dependent oxidoreductase|nr:LLM class F420-dependent oxidoreductase [Acidimicrobiales bacterium]|tara:strand:+ start:5937 stop:6824 length:888 start_codon:yes stop_codon:yes gene_type:complete